MVRIAGEERYVAIEDAGRLRDALGTALPVGVPEAFTEPVRRPARRPRRPLRPHPRAVRRRRGRRPARARASPWSTATAAAAGRHRPGGQPASSGPAAPARSGATPRCCAPSGGGRWPSCGRRSSRSRSTTLARFTARPGSRSAAGCAASTGCCAVVEQLAGALVPASALESLVLPSRVQGYSPAMLDELTSAGEVLWAGAGGAVRRRRLGDAGAGRPGAAAAARAARRRRGRGRVRAPALLEELAGGQALFFRSLSDRVGATDDTALADGDLGPGLGRRADQRHARAAAGPAARRRHAQRQPAAPRGPARPHPLRPHPAGPAGDAQPAPGRRAMAGRWSRVPELETDPTRRTHRPGRGAARAARRADPRRGAGRAGQPAGSPRSTRCCGRSRRPAGPAAATSWRPSARRSSRTPGSVDRLRTFASPDRVAGAGPSCWPPPTRPTPTARRCPGPSGRCAADGEASTSARAPAPKPGTGRAQGRRAGGAGRRRAGALRRAGRQDAAVLDRGRDGAQGGGDGAVRAVASGALGRMAVQRADGAAVHESGPLSAALQAAGFRADPARPAAARADLDVGPAELSGDGRCQRRRPGSAATAGISGGAPCSQGPNRRLTAA